MKGTFSLPAVLSLAAISLAAIAWGSASFAQGRFPERPVDIIVNFGPGGSADQAARAIGTFTGIAITTMVQGISRLKLEDFKFLAIADAGTSMFFVGKGSGFKTFCEALDLAKKSPNKIRVATAGLGTQDDVAVRALTAGHAELLFQQIDGVVSFVESGDLTPIVVFAPKRHPSFPAVPSISEFGFKLNLPNWRSFAAPPAIPDEPRRYSSTP
jgi:tripartite-type tricarboxylate transporter receptor subunit TctC